MASSSAITEAGATETTMDYGGSATVATIHPDILEAHILTRLDGPALASVSCASSQLRSLSSSHHLWTTACHSTWPSTNSPRLRHIISTFPDGPRSFFSQSFVLPLPVNDSKNLGLSPPPPELISAVDIYYRDRLVFSKVQETETITDWFRCSPFRIDLIDPKNVVLTTVTHPDEAACHDLAKDMTLSWIMIDPIRLRTVNLSSWRPVSVRRHWLSGEVQVQFGSVLSGEKGCGSELVQCVVVVTCGGSEEGEMQVREVSLQMEDMDGMHLTGKDSLVIFNRALFGGKSKSKSKSKGISAGRREVESRRWCDEFLEITRMRRERKLRREGRLDTMCIGFGLSLFFAGFWLFVLPLPKGLFPFL